MANGKIWLSSPTMHGDEMKYIQEIFDTNWVAPLGPNVTSFETKWPRISVSIELTKLADSDQKIVVFLKKHLTAPSEVDMNADWVKEYIKKCGAAPNIFDRD